MEEITKKKKGGRVKGSKNKVTKDVTSLLRMNSITILNKSIELALDNPAKYQQILIKLLDKIAPSLQVTTNINISKDFDDKLNGILERADTLRIPQAVEIIPISEVTLLNKEDASNDKTMSYVETVQTKEGNLDEQLNKAYEKKSDRGAINEEGGAIPNANG